MTSSKIKLPNVTLICLTNKDFPAHKKAIDKSCKHIEFGAVKIIWDEKCNSIDEWNRKIVYELVDYVQTSHALLIHADGYVKHPEAWNPDWLKYDYIGSPWPVPKDDISYRDPFGNLIRVGNSVSLRSRKLMLACADLEWKEYYGYTNEDGFICVHNRHILEQRGCKFAPYDVALYFGKEHELGDNEGIETFVFHTVDK